MQTFDFLLDKKRSSSVGMFFCSLEAEHQKAAKDAFEIIGTP